MGCGRRWRAGQFPFPSVAPRRLYLPLSANSARSPDHQCPLDNLLLLQLGAGIGVPVSAGVWALNKYSSTFRNRLGVSGKLAFCVMGAAGGFTLGAERHIISQLPQRLRGPASAGSRRVIAPEVQERWAATKFLMEHPFYLWAGLSAPTVGIIGVHFVRQNHISMSRRLVQVRRRGVGVLPGGWGEPGRAAGPLAHTHARSLPGSVCLAAHGPSLCPCAFHHDPGQVRVMGQMATLGILCTVMLANQALVGPHDGTKRG